MLPQATLLLLAAAAIFTHPLTASPRLLLLPRADDSELELMECGRLPNPPPPIRVVPHRADMELMQCRPIADRSPVASSARRASGSSSLADNVNLPAGSSLSSSSSPRDDVAVYPYDTQASSSRQQQQPYPALLHHPPPQAMNSEIEMANLGLLGPTHVDSSAANGTLPAPAMGTGTTTPSRARCVQCLDACVGRLADAAPALTQICTGERRCSDAEVVGCSLIMLSCCTMLGLSGAIISQT